MPDRILRQQDLRRVANAVVKSELSRTEITTPEFPGSSQTRFLRRFKLQSDLGIGGECAAREMLPDSSAAGIRWIESEEQVTLRAYSGLGTEDYWPVGSEVSAIQTDAGWVIVGSSLWSDLPSDFSPFPYAILRVKTDTLVPDVKDINDTRGRVATSLPLSNDLSLPWTDQYVVLADSEPIGGISAVTPVLGQPIRVRYAPYDGLLADGSKDQEIARLKLGSSPVIGDIWTPGFDGRLRIGSARIPLYWWRYCDPGSVCTSVGANPNTALLPLTCDGQIPNVTLDCSGQWMAVTFVFSFSDLSVFATTPVVDLSIDDYKNLAESLIPQFIPLAAPLRQGNLCNVMSIDTSIDSTRQSKSPTGDPVPFGTVTVLAAYQGNRPDLLGGACFSASSVVVPGGNLYWIAPKEGFIDWGLFPPNVLFAKSDLLLSLQRIAGFDVYTSLVQAGLVVETVGGLGGLYFLDQVAGFRRNDRLLVSPESFPPVRCLDRVERIDEPIASFLEWDGGFKVVSVDETTETAIISGQYLVSNPRIRSTNVSPIPICGLSY